MKVEGGCFCGAVRYRADGEPSSVTHCHCRHCRRTSGAPFLTWTEFGTDEFEFTRGTPVECSTRPGVTRTFCAECGTQITFWDEKDAGVIDVTVGSLDDPEALEPRDHVWSDRMLSWIRMDDGLPRLPRGRNS